MKPFFSPQMKAWNKEATAADLAPEARQTIAHGETVGKMRDGFKPRMGRKKNLLRDEIRFSPRHGFSNTRQSFITGNGFHATAANFIAAAKSFRRPESVNLFVLHGIKASHETVGEQHARLAGQRQRFLGNLFNAQTHDWKIRRKPGKHNPANYTQR
jgi:hypothetical protein